MRPKPALSSRQPGETDRASLIRQVDSQLLGALPRVVRLIALRFALSRLPSAANRYPSKKGVLS